MWWPGMSCNQEKASICGYSTKVHVLLAMNLALAVPKPNNQSLKNLYTR